MTVSELIEELKKYPQDSVEELIAWASRRLVDITANVVSHELRRRDEICRKLLDGIIDED